MNKNEINKKVEDTLNSIDNIEKAEPNPFLFERIMNSLDNRTEEKAAYKENKSYTGKYAIGFAVLLAMNIFSFFTYQSSVNNNSEVTVNTKKETTTTLQNSDPQSSTLKDFAKEYFSETDYNYYTK